MPEERAVLSVKVNWSEEFSPRAANVFRISRVGRDVQVLVGYVNLAAFAEAKEAGETEIEVTPTGSEAVVMSAEPFHRLYQQVVEIHEAMIKSGDIPKEED